MPQQRASVVQLDVDALASGHPTDDLVYRIQSGGAPSSAQRTQSIGRSSSATARSGVARRLPSSKQHATSATWKVEDGYSPSAVRREVWHRGRIRSANVRDAVTVRPSGVKERAKTTTLILGDAQGSEATSPSPLAMLRPTLDGGLGDTTATSIDAVFSSATYSVDHFQPTVSSTVEALPLADLHTTIQCLYDSAQRQRLHHNHDGISLEEDHIGGGGTANPRIADGRSKQPVVGAAMMRPMSRVESEDRFKKSVNEALVREEAAVAARKTLAEAEKLRSRTYTTTSNRPLMKADAGPVVDLMTSGVASASSSPGRRTIGSAVRRGNPEHDTTARLYQEVVRGASRIANQSRPSSSVGALKDVNGVPLAAVHPLTRNIRSKLLLAGKSTDERQEEREDGTDLTADANGKTLPSRLLDVVFRPVQDLVSGGSTPTADPHQRGGRKKDEFTRRSEEIQLGAKRLAQKQQLRKGILGHVLALVNDSEEAKNEVRQRVKLDAAIHHTHRAFSPETVTLPPAVAANLVERAHAKEMKAALAGAPTPSRTDNKAAVASSSPPKNFLATNAADAKLEGYLRREGRHQQFLELERQRLQRAEGLRMSSDVERQHQLETLAATRRGEHLGRDRKWLLIVEMVSVVRSIHSFLVFQKEERAFQQAAKLREEALSAAQRAQYAVQSADAAERIRQLTTSLTTSNRFRRALARWKYARRIEATTIVASLLRTVAANSKIQIQCRRLIERVKILQRIVRRFLRMLANRRALFGDYIEQFICERAAFSRQLCLDFEKEVSKRKQKLVVLPNRATAPVASGAAPQPLSKGAVVLDSALTLVTSFAVNAGAKTVSVNRAESPSGNRNPRVESDERSPASVRGGNVGTPRVLATAAYRYALAVEGYYTSRTEGSQTTINTPNDPVVITPSHHLTNTKVPQWCSFAILQGVKGFVTVCTTSLSEIRRRKGLFPPEGEVLFGGGFDAIAAPTPSADHASRNNSHRPSSSQRSNSVLPLDLPVVSPTASRPGSTHSRPRSSVSVQSSVSKRRPSRTTTQVPPVQQLATAASAKSYSFDFTFELGRYRHRVWANFPPSPDLIFAASCLPGALARHWQNPFSALYFARETHNLPYSERLTSKLPPRLKDILVKFFFSVESKMHKRTLQDWKKQFKAIQAKLEWERELSEYGVAATLLPAPTLQSSPSTPSQDYLSVTPTKGAPLAPAVFDPMKALLQLLPPFPRRRCLPTESEARLIVLVGYALFYAEKKNMGEVSKVVARRMGSVQTPEGRTALEMERQYVYAKTASNSVIAHHCKTQVQRLERTVPGLTEAFVEICIGGDDDDDDINKEGSIAISGGPRSSTSTQLPPS